MIVCVALLFLLNMVLVCCPFVFGVCGCGKAELVAAVEEGKNNTPGGTGCADPKTISSL